MITGVGSGMQGVGRLTNGCVVFVPGALPGENAEIEITKRTSRFCEARLVRVCNASSQRKTPDCAAYGVCGGCQARHMDYSESLRLKRQRVYDALSRIGGVENPNVLETIGCAVPDRTRNKAEFPIGKSADGRITIGAYAENSHKIIPLCDCLSQRLPASRALRFFSEHIQTMPGANHYTNLVARTNRKGELMLILCADAPIADAARKLYPALKAALPELVSFYFLKQNNRPAHALDGTVAHIAGEKVLNETLLDLQFTISPQSFFQINPDQTEKLYACAIQYANLTPASRVLDVYCGAGTITLSAARISNDVTGVEIVPPAIRDAKENARRNGLESRTRFICADAAKEIPRLLKSGEHFDCAIVDPPRKGIDAPALQALLTAQPERIVYVSCNPATLARDVKTLSTAYALTAAQPVDMFPWTEHVETVCLLSKLHSKQHIEVEVKMDEMDLTAAESKATYSEIKAYVLERFHLNVSNLYIAQVKQKHGIIERECYNKSKSEKGKVLHCPADKEAAITAALKHFRMI